jgi:hypothetical protein
VWLTSQLLVLTSGIIPYRLVNTRKPNEGIAMFDQILETIKTLAPVGSLVVSILAYKQSKKEKSQDDE